MKPYGFSRRDLLVGGHVEHERNRVKNVSGKARMPRNPLALPPTREERPCDGRFWVEVQAWPEGQFAFASDGRAVVLDEALRHGADLPFGCRMGSCGMCCARLLQGEVDQRTQIFLTDEQRNEGFVLLCQAKPLSDVTVRLCSDDELDAL